MNVNGKPFSKQAKLDACLNSVTEMAFRGWEVSNVTIKAWRA